MVASFINLVLPDLSQEAWNFADLPAAKVGCRGQIMLQSIKEMVCARDDNNNNNSNSLTFQLHVVDHIFKETANQNISNHQ